MKLWKPPTRRSFMALLAAAAAAAVVIKPSRAKPTVWIGHC